MRWRSRSWKRWSISGWRPSSSTGCSRTATTTCARRQVRGSSSCLPAGASGDADPAALLHGHLAAAQQRPAQPERRGAENLCTVMAQRLSILHGLNAPEFFDKTLFRHFIQSSRNRVWSARMPTAAWATTKARGAGRGCRQARAAGGDSAVDPAGRTGAPSRRQRGDAAARRLTLPGHQAFPRPVCVQLLACDRKP